MQEKVCCRKKIDMWFQFSKDCKWCFHLSLLNLRGVCNEQAAKRVQSQSPEQLETEELDKGTGDAQGTQTPLAGFPGYKGDP